MKHLGIHSRLEELSLHPAAIDISCPGQVAYEFLEKNADTPGIALIQGAKLIGMISRRRFLEALSRAYGRELFLRRPLSVLYSFIQLKILRLSSSTLITEAAQQAIARAPELIYEPVVVVCQTESCCPVQSSYCLLGMHELLQAQSTIHQLTAVLLQEKTRSEIMQTEKMASLGKMMAGMAHEIRNPVNFIWGNLQYVTEYTQDLATLIRAFDQETTEPSVALRKLRNEVDVEFILRDLPKVVQSIATGTERVRNLVTSLRNFSRINEHQRHATDLHQSLDSTLVILDNRLKEGITVHKDYGDLLKIPCYGGQIEQVFMNLVSNAIDALLEYRDRSAKQRSNANPEAVASPSDAWEAHITIKTQISHGLPAEVASQSAPDDYWVSVRIQDNGPGIPEAIQAKIFEDFFTTKPIGEGTGLGLPITREIVTVKHQGHLILRSPCMASTSVTPSRGTEFEVLLPVHPPEMQPPPARNESPNQNQPVLAMAHPAN